MRRVLIVGDGADTEPTKEAKSKMAVKLVCELCGYETAAPDERVLVEEVPTHCGKSMKVIAEK